MLEQEKNEARMLLADFDKAANVLQNIGERLAASQAADIIELISEIHGADRLVQRLVEKGGYKELRTTLDNLWPLHHVWDHLGAVDSEKFIQVLKDNFVVGWLALFADKLKDVSAERILQVCLRENGSYSTFDKLLEATSQALNLNKEQQQELVDFSFEENKTEMRKNSRQHLLSCWLFNLTQVDTETLAFRLLKEYGEAGFVRLYRNKDTSNSLPLKDQAGFAALLFEKGLGNLVFTHRAKFSRLSDSEIADTALKVVSLPEDLKYRDSGMKSLATQGLKVLNGLSRDHAASLLAGGYEEEVRKGFGQFSPEARLFLIGTIGGFNDVNLADALDEAEQVPADIWQKIVATDSAEIALRYITKVDDSLDLAHVAQILRDKKKTFLIADYFEVFSKVENEQELIKSLLTDDPKNPGRRFDRLRLESNLSALLRNNAKFSNSEEVQDKALEVAASKQCEYIICTSVHYLSEEPRSELEKDIIKIISTKNSSDREVIRGALDNVANIRGLNHNDLIASALEVQIDKLDIWNNLKHMKDLTEETFAQVIKLGGFYAALANPEVFVGGTQEKVVQAIIACIRSGETEFTKSHLETVLTNYSEKLDLAARDIVDSYFSG